VASIESLKDFLKGKTLEERKLAQMTKVLYKWFAAMCFVGKYMTGPVINENAKYFHEDAKVTDKCTFS
jgi:hypothetical protein